MDGNRVSAVIESRPASAPLVLRLRNDLRGEQYEFQIASSILSDQRLRIVLVALDVLKQQSGSHHVLRI